jgi:hypothetical protein
MNTTNAANKLTTLTTTNADHAVVAHLTTQQNIILNATLHCMEHLSGDTANSERMISWLASCGISATTYHEGSRINIPFALSYVGDDGIKEVLNVRLGRRYTTGRWFVYATCISELGLPITTCKAEETAHRTDILTPITPITPFTNQWLDS